MSTEMLEDIRDRSQSHLSANRREVRYKRTDFNKQSQAEWKGALLSTRNMGKRLHKVFKAIVNDIFQVLPVLGESDSEFSYFMPEPRNFSEMTILLEDTNKPFQKATLEEIGNLTNNRDFLVQEPEKGETVIPCMDV